MYIAMKRVQCMTSFIIIFAQLTKILRMQVQANFNMGNQTCIKKCKIKLLIFCLPFPILILKNKWNQSSNCWNHSDYDRVFFQPHSFCCITIVTELELHFKASWLLESRFWFLAWPFTVDEKNNKINKNKHALCSVMRLVRIFLWIILISLFSTYKRTERSVLTGHNATLLRQTVRDLLHTVSRRHGTTFGEPVGWNKQIMPGWNLDDESGIGTCLSKLMTHT